LDEKQKIRKFKVGDVIVTENNVEEKDFLGLILSQDVTLNKIFWFKSQKIGSESNTFLNHYFELVQNHVFLKT